MGSRWPGAGRKRLVGDGPSAAAGLVDGDGALVEDWRRRKVDELHGGTVKLSRGVVRFGEGLEWRVHGDSSSPEMKKVGGEVLACEQGRIAFYRQREKG